MTPDPGSASPVASAWATLCDHCDGIAIGTTLEALHAHGAFARMQAGPFRPETIAAACGLRPGFLALAVKLLRSQGFAVRDDDHVVLTADGAVLARRPERMDGASARILQASNLLAALSGSAAAVPGAGLPVLPGPFEDGPLGRRLHRQALGPLAAAAWLGLARRGVLARLRGGAWRPADPAEALALAILERVGWVAARTEGVFVPTPQGEAAMPFPAQYAYPLAYLPTFAAVPSLLRDGRMAGRDAGVEQHVDRLLDIAFSGEVFSRSCREPFLDTVLPLFETQDLAAQPRMIVDTGSGDGTLLAALCEAIRTRTMRGMLLAAFPLVLVGIEYNEIGRAATEARLAGLGVPFLALTGDIGRPDLIAARLAEHGLDPDDALHVNKSVIHNRTYRRSPDPCPASPPTDAVFTADGGEAVPAQDAFGSLVALFAAWRPLLRRHGMVAIEAHTVSPERAAGHIGRSLITALDASHGYSCQLLTEIGVHRAAADAAGLDRLSRRDLGAAMMGEPTMSIDHLKAR